MEHETCDFDEITSKGLTSVCNTPSSCSDLNASVMSTTMGSSSVVSGTSNEQSPRSLDNDTDSVQLGYREGQTTLPFGGCLVHQREAPLSKGGAEAPVSKARQFCQQAFADCGLEKMDEEMAALTEDLESLRCSISLSRRLEV
eukprot:gnl/MRDRNA2_/MRDRNA2_28605_c0_seq2.p2 gnl/MRDRNA2_/MRDRNA2_28605_c0~~gnl/MRDRNA2_/MRDRNA2_28605_c0_seq2.p2  ORF type:complete len:143 (+),score=28.96 gnl/MRDRNA2_/MRDRNA2_28605_c0_seq2:474-902(+)